LLHQILAGSGLEIGLSGRGPDAGRRRSGRRARTCPHPSDRSGRKSAERLHPRDLTTPCRYRGGICPDRLARPEPPRPQVRVDSGPACENTFLRRDDTRHADLLTHGHASRGLLGTVVGLRTTPRSSWSNAPGNP